MEMIPENEKALMMAKWQQKDKEDMEKAIKKGLLSQEQINRAKDLEEQLYNEMRTEGMPKDKELWAEYLATREQGESYPDWYRRVKLLPEKLKGRPLPGPDWVGFCIPLDEEVIDNNGFRLQAKDVTIKHQLNTHLEAGMVKQTFKREINEKINKISLSRNKVESVRLTKKHPILCIQADKCNFNLKHNSICTNKITNWRCDYCTNKKFEDYKIEWINAEDINTNTYILYPLLQCSKENLKLDLINEVDWESINCTVGDNTIYPKSGIRKSMNRFIEIDESIGWLIGYYLADGNVWVTKDRLRGVQFTTSTKTISILELAQKIIEKHFGLRGRIIVRHRKSGNSAYLVVASSMFAKLIDTWVGRYCDKKFAPYWLEKVTCNTQNAILDGLNTGDATKDKRQRLVITNYELTRMAKRIWESNGIGCSFRKKNSRNYKDTYMIEPLWQSSDVFFIKGFVAYRVEENKEIDYQGEVYDFEIENHHSFLTKIAILHNSPQVDLEDVKLKILSQEGKNLFEYDLWPDRVRAVARRPIITKAAEELREPPEKDEKQIREKINAVLAANNIRASHVSLTKVSGLQENELDLRIEEDRAASSKEKIRRLGYG
jgi:intein/homing endonuclease